MKGEVLKGHLDLLLLAAVEPGPRHGYAIIDELKRRSGGAFDLPEGTVYPALHRLERVRLLKSRWVEASGRRRRVYSLTSAGRRALKDQYSLWRSFSAAMEEVLGAV